MMCVRARSNPFELVSSMLT